MDDVYNLPNDTPLHIRAMQVAIVLQKPLAERLKMCTDISEFSLQMLHRHIREGNPDISAAALKFETIKAMYADCYGDEEMTRIEHHFAQFG